MHTSVLFRESSAPPPKRFGYVMLSSVSAMYILHFLDGVKPFLNAIFDMPAHSTRAGDGLTRIIWHSERRGVDAAARLLPQLHDRQHRDKDSQGKVEPCESKRDLRPNNPFTDKTARFALARGAKWVSVAPGCAENWLMADSPFKFGASSCVGIRHICCKSSELGNLRRA